MDGLLPLDTHAERITIARNRQHPLYRSFILVPALLLALSTTTQASSTCATAATEGQMFDCLQRQLKASDHALNTAYKTLIARYKDNGLATNQPSQDLILKKAQLAWIALRDASCDFETYESIGGSGFGTIHTACLLEQTQKRVEYLNGFVGSP
ncbi:lysozyme inhibitor LprI family protein [Pseudomonas frederiksbergensis]|uniref:Lysozyme inhibitor LprI-like N-terminal domain-containing protein n=1 Tax=Pseudomonas frederiksbergensis TaxID=104087 RepID=A0A6L5BUP9_9PSED|nr:lysozyme inhibitor LprI family protein [Pseudomonas frederiksbergensis]KAF2391532.1 hypothetical protein FX983_06017 [Pseudomonas frederiksbergensis]